MSAYKVTCKEGVKVLLSLDSPESINLVEEDIFEFDTYQSTESKMFVVCHRHEDNKEFVISEEDLYDQIKEGSISIYYGEDTGGFKIRELEAFPPNSNPYCHDSFSMGCSIGSNVEVMWVTRLNGEVQSLILVDK